MIIDRLRTSPQFGKYLDSLSIRQFCELENIKNNITQIEYDAIRYNKRKKYDSYIDNALKKEMFVNEIEKPSMSNDCYYGNEEAYNNDMELWQESEKKVIFEDVEIQDRTIHGEKDVFVEKKFIARIRVDKGWAFNNVTVGDFANMTDGQLKLKNCEL